MEQQRSGEIVQILNKFDRDLDPGFGIGRRANILKNRVLEVVSEVECEVCFSGVLEFGVVGLLQCLEGLLAVSLPP